MARDGKRGRLQVSARGHAVRLRIFLLIATLALFAVVVSGGVGLTVHRLAVLCAPMRPVEGLPELRRQLLFARIHDHARLLGYAGALLIVSYAIAAAFQARARGSRRWPLSVAAASLLLAAVVVAAVSGDSMPWRSIEPIVVAAEHPPKELPAVLPPGLGGSPVGCGAGKEAERRAIVRAFWAHLAAGFATLALGLALLPIALRHELERPPSKESAPSDRKSAR